MDFYPGIHHPHIAHHFERCLISINTLRRRKSGFEVHDWILDSGAFTEIDTHGHYRTEPKAYAEQIIRWSTNGNLLAAVSQDMMCEPWIVEKTGLTIAAHQRITIERYDRIRAAVPSHIRIMPVLQGFEPTEYKSHIQQYGDRLTYGMWVGLGSVCRRNGNPAAIEAVLRAIKTERPDLRLHGFGLKLTALGNVFVRDSLESSDSMAWSFGAWKEGRDPNSWEEAQRYCERVSERLAA